MKNIVAILILIVLVGGLSLTFAQKQRTNRAENQSKQDLCPNAMTQFEINRCTAEHFRKADKRLNETYQRILVELEPRDRTNLVEAQRAWLKYRTANCWANRSLFDGGSIAPTVEALCLKDITDERIKELIRIYESEEGKME